MHDGPTAPTEAIVHSPSPSTRSIDEAHERALEQRRITSGPIAVLTRLRTFESLQYRDFLLIWLGQIGNSHAQWMDQITRGYLMYQLTGSPLELGTVNAARALPLLFFSVIAGAVADRQGRKMQLIVAQTTNMVLNAILATLVVTHLVQPWHVYLTAVLAGCVQAFQQPARQSMLSDLVPMRRIRNAVALNAMVINVARGLGPALAGLLIAWVGAGGSYALQALLFAMSALWTIQVQEPAHRLRGGAGGAGTPGELSILRSTAEGARYIWGDPTVRAIMLIVLVPSVLGQPYTSLLPVFAVDILHVGASGQGVLLAAAGVGALLGAIIVASLGNAGRQGLLMLAGAMVFGFSIVGFASSTWFPLSLVLMAINGLCNDSYNTQAQSLLQQHTPAELRGRVMGVYLMNRGTAPLGALLVGALASAIGAPHAIAIMGSCCALLAVWAFVSRPQIRALG
ncbi:MAG: hypothetical protein QOF51_2986 [Chloroflexota bacterium]|jgi:MFS family permease|nr:hypothetical protein [Chloroflexota bacterium]